MARIPTPDQLGQPIVSNAAPTGIDGQDIAAMRAPAEAMQQFGNSVTQTANVLIAQKDKQDDYEMRKRFIDFDLAQDQKLNEMSRAAPDNPQGFTQDWRKSYDADAKAFFKDVPESQRPKYDYMLVQRGSHMQGQAQDFEDKRRDQYYINDVQKQTDGLRTAVTKDPSSLSTNIARGAYLIDGSNLPYPAKEKLKKAFASQAAEDAVRTRIGNGEDPEAVIKDIESAPAAAAFNLSSANAPDFRPHGGDVASVRFNNPGAMWPGPSAKKFGAEESVNLRDGQGNKIAVFPDAVSGAAAQFDLMSNKYAGKTLGGAIRQWSGGNSVGTYLQGIYRDTGLRPDTVLTPEMLRDPEVAIPLAKAMAQHEAGKAYPLNDQEWRAGFNKANGLGDDDKVQVAELGDNAGTPEAAKTEAKDDAALANPNAVSSPYRFLNPVQRRTLINITREAGRADSMDQVANDVAQIKKTGKPTPLPDGRTSLERSKTLLTPQQYRKAADDWHEAELEHEAVAPLSDMSEDEARAHIGEFLPESGATDYAIRDKVAKTADRALTKIIKERKQDPALSVEKTPEVQEAFTTIKQLRTAPNAVDGGTVDAAMAISPVKANQMVIDARIAAQRRLGLTDGEISPVTKREAMNLIQIPDFKSLTDVELPKALRAARERAEAQYGPYAKQVFDHSVALLSKDKRVADASAGVMRKMLDGEPLTVEDYTSADALARASVSDVFFNPNDSASIGVGSMFSPPQIAGFPAQSPDTPGGIFSSARTSRDGSFNTAKSAETNRKPTPEAIQALKSRPDKWQDFEAMYGAGSVAAALSGKADKKEAVDKGP